VVIRHIVRGLNPLKLRIYQLFLVQVLLLERLLLHRLHKLVYVFILGSGIQRLQILYLILFIVDLGLLSFAN
jgi:hypothetical protein